MATKITKKEVGKSTIIRMKHIPNNQSYVHDGERSGEHFDKSTDAKDLLAIPNWSLQEFIKERTAFTRQGMPGSTSGYSDPGTYFYKVFFNFNTAFGLFGSLLPDSTNQYLKDENSAWQYLTNNILGDKFSDNYKKVLQRKRTSLETFAKILNFLTMECPWFFKEISGLNDMLKYKFTDITGKERKTFSIKFNQDAIDMRVSTLMDLYKDACYDYTNFKEVIPENLRLFDMCIIVFNPPTDGLNVYYTTAKDDYPKYKTYGRIQVPKLADVDTNDDCIMTFKCIILKNCEIQIDSVINMQDSISNDEGIKFDSGEFKIAADRTYVYTVNDELNVEILDGLFKENDELDNINTIISTGNLQPEGMNDTIEEPPQPSLEELKQKFLDACRDENGKETITRAELDQYFKDIGSKTAEAQLRQLDKVGNIEEFKNVIDGYYRQKKAEEEAKKKKEEAKKEEEKEEAKKEEEKND